MPSNQVKTRVETPEINARALQHADLFRSVKAETRYLLLDSVDRRVKMSKT